MHSHIRTRKKKSNRRREEAQQQCGGAAYLGQQRDPNLAWFSIDVGGYRRPVEAAQLKARGLKAGTPDMCILVKGQPPTFIEWKSAAGRVAPVQKVFHDYLRQAGAQVEILRSLEQLEALLVRLGVNLTASMKERK